MGVPLYVVHLFFLCYHLTRLEQHPSSPLSSAILNLLKELAEHFLWGAKERKRRIPFTFHLLFKNLSNFLLPVYRIKSNLLYLARQDLDNLRPIPASPTQP